MSGGFASGTKFRVINPQDSFEVESVSSLAPPPCYSSFREGATSLTSLCIGQNMNQPNENEDSHNDDSRSAHYSCLYEETWPEARLPSPYSFEDLPGFLNHPQEYLAPAAPSSTYTQSFLLGHSPAQLSRDTYETTAITSCDSHTTQTFNPPLESQIFSSRVPTGRLSTPNISSFYRQGISRNQLLYHQAPASQPIISHLSYQPPIVSSEPDGEAADPNELQNARLAGGDGSKLHGEFSCLSGSASLAHLGQGRPTNFVSLSRKRTSKRSTFSFFPLRHKAESASITGSFVIDPHLRLPPGLLKAVDSGSTSAVALRTRKNLVLEVENGSINVDIHLTPSMPPSRRLRKFSTTSSAIIPDQTEPRRSTDKRYLHSDPAQAPNICGQQDMRRSRSQLAPMQDRDPQIPTRIELRLKEGPGVPPSSAKYKLIARVNAPNPRLPIHLLASTIDSPPTQQQPKILPTNGIPRRSKSRRLQSNNPHRRSKPQSKSPVYLHLPRTLHGPLTIHVASGNIDEHVRLSKELASIAVILNESALSRGYFVSSSGLAEFGFSFGFADLDGGEDGWVLVEGLDSIRAGTTTDNGGGGGGSGYAFIGQGNRSRTGTGRDGAGWYGDKVDVVVGDGKVYLQFIDEEDPFGRQKGFWQSLGLGCR